MATYAAVLRIVNDIGEHYDTRVIVYDAFDLRQARKVPLAYFDNVKGENGWFDCDVSDVVRFTFSKDRAGSALPSRPGKDYFRWEARMRDFVASANVRSLEELVFPDEEIPSRSVVPSPTPPYEIRRLISD